MAYAEAQPVVRVSGWLSVIAFSQLRCTWTSILL